MQKIIALVVAVCFIVSLAGCSSAPAAGPGPSSSGVAASPASQPAVELSVEERVLFEENDLRVTLKSIAVDGFLGPALQILVENNGTKELAVQTRNTSINGIMAEPMFSCSVAPGQKANEEILFMSSALKKAGIETILEVELSFHVFDSASWTDSFDS